MIIRTELADGSIQTIVSTSVVYLRGATQMERSEGAETIIRLNGGFGYESIDGIAELRGGLAALGVRFLELHLVNGTSAFVVGALIGRVSRVPATAHPEAKSWLHYAGGKLQVRDTEDVLRQAWHAADLDTSVFD